MENERTVDSIIANMTHLVVNKIPISPQQWLDGALYLHILSTDETAKLVDLELKVNRIKREWIELENSNADAKSKAEATEDYAEYKKQKHRVEFIETYINLAKKYATLSADKFGA